MVSGSETSQNEGRTNESAFIMLINSSIPAVLMCINDGEWDLPCFKYPESLVQGCFVQNMCDDFKNWVSKGDETLFFTAAVELLGAHLREVEQTDDKEMYVQKDSLYLLEIHGKHSVEELQLPDNADWKRGEFASSVLSEKPGTVRNDIFETVRDWLQSPSNFSLSISDQRYRLGWFEKASEMLREIAKSQSADSHERVIQQQMTSASTILKLKTSKGYYFLKSPTIGSNEVTVTAKIASLFSETSPVVVGTSDELRCFITEEFEEKEQGEEDLRNAVLALGRLQLKSLHHLNELKDAGCPSRDSKALETEMSKWVTSSRASTFYDLGILNPTMPYFWDMAEMLAQFNIPHTLVHGDFALTNTTYVWKEGKKHVMFFDWGLGYIGHPFCDFHRIHKKIPSNVLDEYLMLWLSYETLDRAREAYDIAIKLGWIMKAWSVCEWTEKCNAQKFSMLAKWMETIIDESGGEIWDQMNAKWDPQRP